jgi:hypothetical protein
MKRIVLTTALLSLAVPVYFGTDSQPNQREKPLQVAVMCFFKHEYISGMNKICIYDCLGSDTAITISNISLCPMSINR